MVFLGDELASDLFGEREPVGETLKLNGSPFTVIGVMETRPSILGDSQNNFVLLPHPTYKKLYPEEKELLLVG